LLFPHEFLVSQILKSGYIRFAWNFALLEEIRYFACLKKFALLEETRLLDEISFPPFKRIGGKAIAKLVP